MTPAIKTHPTDDDLVLHYYGEGQRRESIEVHLAECVQCARTFEDIAATLSLVVEGPIPERGEHYGLEVWQRIRPELPANRPLSWWPRAGWQFATLIGALAVLVLAAFVAGRFWRGAPDARPVNIAQAAPEAGAEQRVRLVALADHLEQSERVLLDLKHDTDPDVTRTQQWAEGLIDANRLHREAAVQAGDDAIAAVLDDLERTLLDLVHAPVTPTQEELDALRARLDAAALLFKVRILSNELRERETAPPSTRNAI